MPSSYLAKAKPSSKSGEALVKHWMDEIEASLRREKTWLKDARCAIDIYEGETEQPFNILYSNTETLSPALYNSTPRPDVAPRHKDENPIAQAAAALCQSYLTFFVDSGDPTYPSFDELNIAAVAQALVPGRGAVWFKYDADVAKDEATGEPTQVNYETVCGEMVPYDRLLEGYGRTWQEVPWIARIHVYTEEDAQRDFGKKASLISFEERKDGQEKNDADPQPQIQGAEGAKLGLVYEIWSKTNREVLFITPGAKEPLRRTEDPLHLEGFFPTPEPMKFFRRVSSNVPRTLYKVYENQAKELNRVTVRIQRIIEALKIRGFYDSTVEGIAKALEQEDNILLPIENVAALIGRGGKLEDAIFTFPVEKLVGVLQQLYTQREQIKQVIYEITGISDILRGASVASETATAQNLKDQWGSLRLRRFQKEVARYVRDSLRIVAEIAFEKLSPETLIACTGSKLPRKADQERAKLILSQAQMMGQQPPPELELVLKAPAFEDVHAVLKQDLLRRYNIDIETNSTVDAEATEDKKDIGEFMNAMAQFLAGISPLIENGTLPFEGAKAMLLAIVKRYRFGREVEEQISSMAPPQQPSGEEIKKMQAEMEARAKELDQREQAVKDELTKVEDEKRALETMRKEFQAELKVAQAEEKARLATENAQRQADEAVMQAQQVQRTADEDARHTEMRSGLEAILAKIEESAAAAQASPGEGDNQVLAQVTEALAQLESRLTSAVQAASQTKMRASRQPDGSWLREPVQE